MPGSAFPTDLQFAEAICRAWDTQDDREVVAFFEQVPQFDEWTRREVWHFPVPQQFVALNSLAPDQSARFLGVPGLIYALACHRNGHVRSDAVSLLARLDTPVALALLLVRVNDWAAPP